MNIFLTLLFKLIPLYIIIFLGFIAGKRLKIQKEVIAPLLIYIIAPVVVFNGVVTTQITLEKLALPFLFLALATLMSLSFLFISRFLWQDTTRNILAFTAGTGNTGYFGLPVALALFDQNIFGLAVLSLLGFLLYENTIGFFVVAKGHHTVKESLLKILKLPTFYAFFIGVIVNLMSIHLGQNFFDAVNHFKGAYTVLGMMLIGLGLSSIKEFRFDFKFIGLAFFAKFIVWPLLIMLVIYIDSTWFKFFNADIYKIMTLVSIVPLAANTVAYATELRAQPEKASLAVLLSTVFALFYIPFVATLFL